MTGKRFDAEGAVEGIPDVVEGFVAAGTAGPSTEPPVPAEPDAAEGQPALRIGPKPGRPVPDRVQTPLGTAGFAEGFTPGDRGWSYETVPLDWHGPFGRAGITFHVDSGQDGEAPVVLRVVASGGGESWGEPRGEPVMRAGRAVAWVAHLDIDPATDLAAGGATVRVMLSEHAPPDERRLLGIMPPPVEDPGLRADIVDGILDLARDWHRSDRGHAARTYAAMMRARLVQEDAACVEANAAMMRVVALRDSVARLARSAESIASRREGRLAAWTKPVDDTVIEMRGFHDGARVDPCDLDEILVHGCETVHLETMSAKSTWMGIYLPDGRRLSVRFNVEKGRLVVGAEIDDAGLD
jgi:hypothetical protein